MEISSQTGRHFPLTGVDVSDVIIADVEFKDSAPPLTGEDVSNVITAEEELGRRKCVYF
jgi:hypothetical protein